MKVNLLWMLVVSVLLVGCGSATSTDVVSGAEKTQVQEEQAQEVQTQEGQMQETQKQEESHVHVYVETVITEVSCETAGVKTFSCECGDSYPETIAATGHVFDNYVFNNDATYTADGTESATCVCGLTV